MIQQLDVFLWDEKVGTLSSYIDKYREKACFYYDPDFLKSGIDPSPLANSAQSPAIQRGMPVYAESDKRFSGLPAFISDSLPEHWGDKLFAAWAKSKGLNSRMISSLDKLGYIGTRGMGALEFRPPSEPSLEQAMRIDIASLFQQSQMVLESARIFHASTIPELIIESLYRVGTSAGGRRPKAIVNIDYASGECWSGQLAPPDKRFIPSIIKFEENIDIPSTRIEYAYYLMAQEAGLKMMPSRLISVDGKKHFITERYDRIGSTKLHTQTLCALMPSADSYEDLFVAATKLKLAPESHRDIFKAMVMNVICGNVDDHNKNFCFIMNQEGKWSFAPTYDFTFSVDPDASRYENAHSLSICGKTSEITKSDLFQIAQDFNIRNPQSIIDHCVSSAANFHSHAIAADIDSRWEKLIISEISRQVEALTPKPLL